MSEDNPKYENHNKYNVEFQDKAQGVQVGNHNIIHNYFGYREEVVSAAPVDASDDNLPCPYRGLYHFSPNDAEYFFGRDVFVKKLFQAAQTRNFIPVLGASGSGKSSVVFAGLLPKLEHEGNWKYTYFRPSEGNDPFYALAEALVPLYRLDSDSTDEMTQANKLAKSLKEGGLSLAKVFSKIQRKHPNHKVLLFADQFEELYTQYSDLEYRRRFLDCLLASFQASSSGTSSSNILVTTMRADFLANALSYRPFADMLQNADIKLGAMSRKELTDVIEKPAKKLGATFEAGLVERILYDVENEPGNLPLLEFALTKLWKKRTGKQLTHDAYEAIGQVKGALADHANNWYEELKSKKEQQQVRRIFTQLVRPGEGTEDTRRRANRAELEENWNLITRKDGLANSKLVVTNHNDAEQETVEIVHEALIKNWGKLQEWMKADRKFRLWQENLRVAIRKWENSGKDKEVLLRGFLLDEAEDWHEKRSVELSKKEKDFIEESKNERDRQEREKEKQRQREIEAQRKLAQAKEKALQESQKREAEQRKANKKLLQGSMFLGFLFVVASGLGLIAWNQTKQAELNLANSLARTSISLSNDNTRDLDTLMLALKAGKIIQKYKTIDPKVVQALSKTVSLTWERNRLEGHNDDVTSVSISPDGKTLASGSADNTIKLWNLETGEEIRTLKYNEGVWEVSISPDGKTLAFIIGDNTIKLWNLETGEEIRTFQGHDDNFINDISISPDGQTLASSSWDKTIKLWNLETGKEIHTLEGHGNVVGRVSISPDGQTLASGSWDKTIKLWNIETGEEIRTFQGHDSIIRNVSISPDGKTLASGSNDDTIRLWDLETEEIRTLKGHDDAVGSVSFSPDGKTLASSSDDGTIKLWNLNTGEEIRTLQGHDSVVFGVSFSPDGKTLASSSDDGTIKLWNLNTGEEIHTLEGHDDAVGSVSFSPDGQTLASSSDDGTIRLWHQNQDWDFDALMGRGCDWIRNYLTYNSYVSHSDRHLCDGIGIKK